MGGLVGDTDWPVEIKFDNKSYIKLEIKLGNKSYTWIARLGWVGWLGIQIDQLELFSSLSSNYFVMSEVLNLDSVSKCCRLGQHKW